MSVRLCIGVAHAAFDEERRRAFEPLRASLFRQCLRAGVSLHVEDDREARGSLGPYLRCCEWAVSGGVGLADVTHFMFLPDDVELVPDFVHVAQRLIEARPNALLCMLSNHVDAPLAAALSRAAREALIGRGLAALEGEMRTASDAQRKAAFAAWTVRYRRLQASLDLDASYRWYSTLEGSMLMGGVFPIDLLREHLAWRREKIRPDCQGFSGGLEPGTVQGDQGVNLWAIATSRLIYKPLPSPLQHPDVMVSLDGNEHHKGRVNRTALVWDPAFDFLSADWAGPAADLGRSYLNTHWDVLFKLFELSPELVERVYAAEREDEPMPFTSRILMGDSDG